MWLFCKQGFYSAVQHRDNPEIILLRARFDGDLECLLEHCGCENYKVFIKETPDADYRFRVELPRAMWGDIVKQVADEIDYDNFKNSVHEGQGSARDAAYMGCWWELRKGQAAKW